MKIVIARCKESGLYFRRRGSRASQRLVPLAKAVPFTRRSDLVSSLRCSRKNPADFEIITLDLDSLIEFKYAEQQQNGKSALTP